MIVSRRGADSQHGGGLIVSTGGGGLIVSRRG